MDLTKSIEPKSDQMNAEDLLSGPRTFTITDIRAGSSEQPVSVFLAEHPQPFKPSKTVIRLMVLAWGVESSAHIGQRMTLYRDETVLWAGKEAGGIRVSHMSGIRKQLSIALPIRKGTKQRYVVDPLPDVAPPARGGQQPGPLDQLVAAFDAAGIVGKVDRLAYCRGIVQRGIGSANDLTAGELAEVIAALAAPPVASGPSLADVPVAPEPGEPSEEELAAIAERELGGDR